MSGSWIRGKRTTGSSTFTGERRSFLGFHVLGPGDTESSPSEPAGRARENGEKLENIFYAHRSSRAGGRSAALKARDFDSLLFGTIEDILREVFEEPSVNLIFQYIEEGCPLKRVEIPRRVAAFSLALREIFGQSSVPLERSILRSLHSKLGLKFEEEEHDFTDVVEELRRRFEG